MAEAKISVEIELLDKSSEDFKRFEQKVLRFKGNVEGSLRQVSTAGKVATKDIKALNAQLNDKSGLASGKAANGLKVTGQSVKQLSPSLNAARISFGGVTQGMAAFIGVSAGLAGVVAGMRRLIAAGRDYSIVLAEISTLTDESSFSASTQRGIVEGLADSYGVLQNEVGKGLYQTISAGATDAAQANAILTESIGLSIAGVASVKESVDIMTSTLNSYGEENITAAHAADVLFETVKRGKTTMSELASVLGRVLPLAREVGVSFEEVNAAVVSQTKQGASTAEAVTRLRSIFSALIKKQDEVAELFQNRLGLAFNEDTIGSIGLVKTLDLLKRATAGNRDELTKLIGRIEGTTGVLALTTENSKDFKEALDGIKGASGTAGNALNEFRNTAGRKLEEFWSGVTNQTSRYGETVSEVVVSVLQSMGLIETRNENFTQAFASSLQAPVSGLSELGEAYAEILKMQNREVVFPVGSSEIERQAARVSYIERRLADLGSETIKLAADASGVRAEYDLLNEGVLETIGKAVAGFEDPRGSGEEANRAAARLVEDFIGSVPPISLDLTLSGLNVQNPEALVSGLDDAMSFAFSKMDVSEASDVRANFLASEFAEKFKMAIGHSVGDVLESDELLSAAALTSAPELYDKAIREGMEKISLTLDNGSTVIVDRFEMVAGQITPIFGEVMDSAAESVKNGLVVIEKTLQTLSPDLSISFEGFGSISGSTDEVAKRGAEISEIISSQEEANQRLLESEKSLLRVRKDSVAAQVDGTAKKNAEAEIKLLEQKIQLAEAALDGKISEAEFSARSLSVQRAYELELSKIRSDSQDEFRSKTEDFFSSIAKGYKEWSDAAKKNAKEREAALQDEADLQAVVMQARREGLTEEEHAYAKIAAKFDELRAKALQQNKASEDSLAQVLAILAAEEARVVAVQRQTDLKERQAEADKYLQDTITVGRENELNIARAIAYMQSDIVGQAYDEAEAISERVRVRKEELALAVESGTLSSEKAAEEIRTMESLAELDRRRVDENLKLRAIQDGAGAFGESFSAGISSAMSNLTTMGDLGRELGSTFANSAGQFASAMATNSASFEVFKNTVIAGLLQVIAKWAILRVISGFGFGAAGADGPIGPVQADGTFAKGGVMGGKLLGTTSLPVNAYANGGVASTPQLAIFGEGRGAEAFVPLPDGRRIPVDMGGVFTALSSQMRAMTSMMSGGAGGRASSSSTVNLTVDARGAQDAASVEAAVQRSLLKSMPRIEKALGNSMSAGNSGALTRGVRHVSRGR